METCIDYVDYEVATVSTDEPKWHRRLREYARLYPDQVRIKTEPETNDGCMVATVPVNYVKIQPPRRLNLSDEEKVARVEKMRNSAARRRESRGVEERSDDR